MNKPTIRAIAQAGPQKIAYAALTAFGVLAIAVTITAIAESYSNQVDFALAHQMITWHGRIAPVAVDAFIVLGELLLFAGLLLKWRGWGLYAFSILLVLGGFAMSVAANVWHARTATAVDRAIQAIWPVTATAALAGCLIIIKRLTADRAAEDPGTSSGKHREPRPVPRPAAEAGPERAARAPELVPASVAELAALSADEQSLAVILKARRGPLPSARELARTEDAVMGSRRRAGYVLAAVRAGSNGNGHGDRDDGA